LNLFIKSKVMNKQLIVVKSNILFLQQGIELLRNISDELYTSDNGRYHKSGIGRHFRHIIEHYFSFLNGYAGKIDYDNRERDPRLETDRMFMINKFREVTDSLEAIYHDPELLDQRVEVRTNEGIGEDGSPLSSSSYRRELQFLISHTVHHYALIGLILKTLDYTPDPSFGVAPSTLKFELDNINRH